MNTNQAKMDDRLEEAKAWRKETTAYQEETEACVAKLEVNREKPDSVAEHQEVSKFLIRKRLQ
jgi:hypothetical protein